MAAMRQGYIDTSNQISVLTSCHHYLSQRRSTYEFRSIRYEAVYNQLKELGLKNGDSIVDVGAGDQEFLRYLEEQDWTGDYTPVDGLIDGTDLNLWVPDKKADYFVCIEVVEHLYKPLEMLYTLDLFALKGAVVTTPNPTVVDVYAMDSTHISEVSAMDFCRQGWKAVPQIFFFEPEDSLMAWVDNR